MTDARREPVTRFTCAPDGVMVKDKYGTWVRCTDYRALADQLAASEEINRIAAINLSDLEERLTLAVAEKADAQATIARLETSLTSANTLADTYYHEREGLKQQVARLREWAQKKLESGQPDYESGDMPDHVEAFHNGYEMAINDLIAYLAVSQQALRETGA